MRTHQMTNQPQETDPLKMFVLILFAPIILSIAFSTAIFWVPYLLIKQGIENEARRQQEEIESRRIWR